MKHRGTPGLHPRQVGTGGPAARNGRVGWQYGPAENCERPHDLWDRWTDCQLWPDCVDADGVPAAELDRGRPAAAA